MGTDPHGGLDYLVFQEIDLLDLNLVLWDYRSHLSLSLQLIQAWAVCIAAQLGRGPQSGLSVCLYTCKGLQAQFAVLTEKQEKVHGTQSLSFACHSMAFFRSFPSGHPPLTA